MKNFIKRFNLVIVGWCFCFLVLVIKFNCWYILNVVVILVGFSFIFYVGLVIVKIDVKCDR